jgi:hypothetical protein
MVSMGWVFVILGDIHVEACVLRLRLSISEREEQT